MRTAFLRELAAIGAADPRVVLITGDLGFMAVEPFAEACPGRFFNAGVAEQDMIGIASGLAEAGFLPFCYSIAPFASLRPFEFIRNGPAHHVWPVRAVGVGGGFDYGHAGYSHHGLEDIAVMRALPAMNVIAPAEPAQAAAALRATWDLPGPVYYRIGKDDRVAVPGLDGRFTLGGIERIREGGDCLVVATGAVAADAARAAVLLEARGVSAGLAVVASIRPAPDDALAAAMAGVPLVVTVEAHQRDGGLGSLVAEIIAERGIPARLLRRAARAHPGGGVGGSGRTGSAAWLHRQHGLDAESLAAAVAGALA
ncbi:MAG: transketolase family protein [Chloroflexota bacterium]